ISNRVIRIEAEDSFLDWGRIQPGVTKMSVPVRGVAHFGPNEVIRIIESENIYFENISIWSAPWFAVGVTRNRGEIVFKRTNVIPKPNSNRLTSSWRDGFHVASNYANLLFEECHIAGTNDDAFNI